jgi:hypothetical protein
MKAYGSVASPKAQESLKNMNQEDFFDDED